MLYIPFHFSGLTSKHSMQTRTVNTKREVKSAIDGKLEWNDNSTLFAYFFCQFHCLVTNIIWIGQV